MVISLLQSINMNISALQNAIQTEINELLSKLENTNEHDFFISKNNKWSIAENTAHLILSVKPINMGLSLPKFIFLFFGKLNRAAMSYDEVVNKYQSKLKNGAVATSAYIPNKKHQDKKILLAKLKEAYQLLNQKTSSWEEADMDRYLMPHPIIGKITVREMLYFTLYHIQHHKETIAAHQ